MAQAQQAFVISVGVVWVVKVRGETVASKFLQHEAINAGRAWLQGHGGGELVILNEQGQIRQKDTVAPGHDPRNIPG